jgi:hypothetical protein
MTCSSVDFEVKTSLAILVLITRSAWFFGDDMLCTDHKKKMKASVWSFDELKLNK